VVVIAKKKVDAVLAIAETARYVVVVSAEEGVKGTASLP
jgi:hypothetical protein